MAAADRREVVMDAVYLALTVLFFGLSLALVGLCSRM